MSCKLHKSLHIQDGFSQALGSSPRHLQTRMLTQRPVTSSLDPGTPVALAFGGVGRGLALAG